jgi:hypothetical protein
MKSLLTLLCLLLTGCSEPDNKPQDGQAGRISELRAKYIGMHELARSRFDQETGWPSKNDCDGTLWAGLAYAGGMKSVKIELAEHKPGEIHRRPFKPCWDGQDQGSRTTVSRDMLAGYMFALWAKQDLEGLKRLASYGEANNWIMGKPFDDGRVFLSGNGIGLLGRMIKKLNGPEKVYRHIQPIFTRGEDYELHLMLVGILLNAFVDEKLDMTYDVAQTVDVTDRQKDLLEWAASEFPENATAQAAWATYHDGDFTKAIDLLLKDDYPMPGYVRGDENYKLVYWLFSAKLVLLRFD